MELYLILENNGHSSSVPFTSWTRPHFSGEKAALKRSCLTATFCESPLASTFAAPSRGSRPFPISSFNFLNDSKWPDVWREASEPQQGLYPLTVDLRFPSLHGLGLPSVSPNRIFTPYPKGGSTCRVPSLHGLGPPSVSPNGGST